VGERLEETGMGRCVVAKSLQCRTPKGRLRQPETMRIPSKGKEYVLAFRGTAREIVPAFRGAAYLALPERVFETLASGKLASALDAGIDASFVSEG